MHALSWGRAFLIFCALIAVWWGWAAIERGRAHREARAVSTLPDGVEIAVTQAFDSRLAKTIRRDGDLLFVQDTLFDKTTIIRGVTSFDVGCVGLSVDIDFHLGDASPYISLRLNDGIDLGVDPDSIAAGRLCNSMEGRARQYVVDKIRALPLAPPVQTQGRPRDYDYGPDPDDRRSRYDP